jgi:ATP-binding cassette subfamily C exporter for protease/lipase
VVAAILQTFVGWLNERSTKPPLMAANQSAALAQQYADGTLRNSEVIESMGMLRDIHGRWIEKQREFLGLQAKASDYAGFYQAISKFCKTWSAPCCSDWVPGCCCATSSMAAPLT